MKMPTLFIIALLLLCTQTVQAEPMYIEFTAMMQQAQTIVIADFIGPVSPDAALVSDYNLVVHQVLKGEATTGKLIVHRAHGQVNLKPNTKVVAFLNADNEFEWVGTTKGTDLEKDVLFLHGFYDYNAYMVAPSSLTLKQLHEYMDEGYYTFKAAGYLHFYNSKTQSMEPSKTYFEVQKQYPTGKQQVKVNDLNLGSFSKHQAKMSMPGGAEAIFSVEYETNMVRPLKFKAAIEGFNATKQQFDAWFWVMAPEEMTPELFQDYLVKPQYGHPYYEIEIHRKKGSPYLFTYHEEGGRIGTLSGYDNSLWRCSSLGDPSATESNDMVFGYYKEDKVIVRMKKLSKMVNYYNYPYRQDRLIRVLRVQPIEGHIIYKNPSGEEEVLEDCVIKLKATKWAKNVNYRE